MEKSRKINDEKEGAPCLHNCLHVRSLFNCSVCFVLHTKEKSGVKQENVYETSNLKLQELLFCDLALFQIESP